MPKMAVFAKEGRQTEAIGAGTIISIGNASDMSKGGLIEVSFLDRTVWMFAQDLRARAVEVKRPHDENRAANLDRGSG
jgi:hypothetical protein